MTLVHRSSSAWRSWSLALSGCAWLVVGGCVRSPSSTDSQAHFLQTCEQDSDCGELSCLCRVCSAPCDSASDCGTYASAELSCVEPAASDECTDMMPGDRLCLTVVHQADQAASAMGSSPNRASSDAAANDAASSMSSESSIKASAMRIPREAAPVPACPTLGRTSAIPAFSIWTEMGDYSGLATVNQITENNSVVLVPNDVVGATVELRFHQPPPASLPLGQRVEITLRRPAGVDTEYALLVVRDDAGKLLLARQMGTDQLYQEGLFAAPDMLGATLSLTMLCQSPEPDGCFANQTQADYTGTFSADTTVALDTSSMGELAIEGANYQLLFFSTSVDGGQPTADCASLTPHRYLDFTLIRE